MRRLLALLLALTGSASAADPAKDTPDDVKKALAAKTAVLLDVREPKEWAAGHLRDAELLPLSRLKAGVGKDELDKKLPKGKVAYLHCKSGGRSLVAADILTKQGYEVRSLAEGFDDLVKAGLPKAEPAK